MRRDLGEDIDAGFHLDFENTVHIKEDAKLVKEVAVAEQHYQPVVDLFLDSLGLNFLSVQPRVHWNTWES
jgi:hypothetical protein